MNNQGQQFQNSPSDVPGAPPSAAQPTAGATAAAGSVSSESDARTVNNTDAVRHNYRQLSDAEKAQMVTIKDKGKALIDEIHSMCAEAEGDVESLPHDLRVAYQKVQEGVMWAVHHLTA